MIGAVREIRTDASELVTELRALADRIESGDLPATTAYVVTRQRTGETVSTTLCGERLSYSHVMGLLAYAQAWEFQQAQEG